MSLQIFKILFFCTITYSCCSQKLEQKSLDYFINNLKDIDNSLESDRFYFSGYIDNKITDSNDVKYCFNEINFASFLTNLKNKIRENSTDKIIVLENDFFKKKCFLKKNRLTSLILMQPLKYKENTYVEIYLYNRKENWSKIIIIRFEDEDPIDHCFKWINYN